MIGIVTKVGVMAGRTGLKVQQFAPEILIGSGIAGVVASGVMCCKATLKVEKILSDDRELIGKINKVKELKDSGEDIDYSDQDYKKDLTIAYSRAAWKMIKLYGPYITLGAVSIVAILSGYNILSKRNFALAAAYKVVEESFSKYREGVISEYGKDVDEKLRYGFDKKDIEVTEEVEEGVEKTEKIKGARVIPGVNCSPYARFFDASCNDWSKNADYNLTFLKAQEQYANDLLTTRGHIFLNEVYDMIGIPRTPEGAVVGWVKGNGDDYVDFNIYDGYSDAARRFVNGYENVILLDFNVDGVIWDKI